MHLPLLLTGMLFLQIKTLLILIFFRTLHKFLSQSFYDNPVQMEFFLSTISPAYSLLQYLEQSEVVLSNIYWMNYLKWCWSWRSETSRKWCHFICVESVDWFTRTCFGFILFFLSINRGEKKIPRNTDRSLSCWLIILARIWNILCLLWILNELYKNN